MDDELREITEPAAYLAHLSEHEPPAGTHPHHGPIETVREVGYRMTAAEV